ncbi:Crp/Fnr family transcriptional regulator [Niabella beijingensis]|uniref:Crp/Fnr family transcriptional regulator n=1 Tax=Niabella beijingensis TaxID=2872700 RepID=UPI001CC16B9B|nr:Crp/Fnr family transcriptional regulator [Niabella beijingensis]MBZ4189607.1 Crp/Fnr family transcriptional regulator [Niabella beijingensis]
MQQLIQAVRSLIPLTSKEEQVIGRLFTARKYKKGSYFLSEGAICKYAGFISKGLMRFYINVDGEEKTYGFLQEHQFISNYGSFVPRIPSLQSIQALEDSELYVITYANLQKLYQELKHGERMGRVIIEQVFIQALADLNSFYTDTPEARYRKFITEHPDLGQRVSQYHIASFVGVKPQSLSRIRKRILHQGAKDF